MGNDQTPEQNRKTRPIPTSIRTPHRNNTPFGVTTSIEYPIYVGIPLFFVTKHWLKSVNGEIDAGFDLPIVLNMA